MLLNGLRDIDWSKLTHARGNASDIPDLLETLLSENIAIIRQSLSALSRLIINPRTIYSVTPYITAFVLDIAQHTPDKAIRRNMLDLLGSISENLPEGEVATEQVRAVLKPALPFFLELVRTSGDGSLIAHILVQYPEEIKTTALVLCAAITHTPSIDFATHYLVTLRNVLAAAMPLDGAFLTQHLVFVEPYLTHADNTLRLAAAEACIVLAGEFSPNNALEIVCDTFIHPEKYQDFLPISPLDYIFESFKYLPASRVLFQLLKCLPYTQPLHTHKIGSFLLEQMLGLKPKPSTIQGQNVIFPPPLRRQDVRLNLTREQYMIVAVLAPYDAFWRSKFSVFQAFGLPATRDELQAFLADNKPD